MAREPVESTSTFILVLLPSRMIEPSPNCFVIAERARSMFLSRAWVAGATAAALAGTGAALDMGGEQLKVERLRWTELAQP